MIERQRDHKILLGFYGAYTYEPFRLLASANSTTLVELIIELIGALFIGELLKRHVSIKYIVESIFIMYHFESGF